MSDIAEKTILIVDDDEDVRRSLERYLRKKGYSVSTASGGEKALEMIGRKEPALVLLDVLMAGMDGIETLDVLRKRFPKVEVVMISALKEEVVARESLKMGAYEWLPKPFSMEHLETTILVTLMRQAGQTGLPAESR